MIDVGISESESRNKKLIVLLCSPSMFFENRSRFYFYKLAEYSNHKEIQKDIGWRDQKIIENYVLAAKFLSLENLIKIMYDGFSHNDIEDALDQLDHTKSVWKG